MQVNPPRHFRQGSTGKKPQYANSFGRLHAEDQRSEQGIVGDSVRFQRF
jgi:hypothetical protein